MPKIDVGTGDALIVVDVQPTFMPGGGLAVPRGDEIVPVVRDLMGRFVHRYATLDRHPRGHISLASSYTRYAPMHALTWEAALELGMEFPGIIGADSAFDEEELASYLKAVGLQVLWPDHAIDGTEEARLHPAFSEGEFAFVQVKGMDPACDSYSGFYDNLRRPTGFADVVGSSGASRIFVCGLAFDFCVGWTALDAIETLHDVEVLVVEDACRSVNMPGSIHGMKDRLRKEGVRLVSSADILDG